MEWANRLVRTTSYGFLSLLLWAGAMELHALECSTILQEDFSPCPLGSTPAGWTVSAESVRACRVSGMAGSIDKVLKISLFDGSGTISAERRFPSVRGVAIVEWHFFESESGRGQAFVLEDSAGREACRVFVDSVGNLCFNDSRLVVQAGIVSNHLYKITILAMLDVDRCDLLVNDVPAASEVPFLVPLEEISCFTVRYGGADRGILHVSDLKVSSVGSLPARTVHVHLDRERQGIDGVGFCHEGDRSRKEPYVFNDQLLGMLDNNMSLFRDRFPGTVWEPVNDNGDPSEIAMDNFAIGSPQVLTTIERLKEMRDRGVTTILGIWNVPDWMISNPGARNARRIENLDEFAESVCAFLSFGKRKNGCIVDFVDVNETEMVGINLRLTASEYGAFVKKCAALFRRHGLTTRVNIGSTLKWGAPYVREMLGDPGVRTLGGYPSYHSYRGTGTEPNDNGTFIEWGDLRRGLDRNLWCTETDYDAFLWENPERLEFRGVIEMAFNYWRVYYLARTSATAGWFWRPDYPSHEVHRAYMNFFEPGGTVVEASQNYPGIYTVAYKHRKKRRFVLQVLNASSRGGVVTFSGVPNRRLTLLRTGSDGSRFSEAGTFDPVDHRVEIAIDGPSFNTIHGELD